jgi:hypothetical protein
MKKRLHLGNLGGDRIRKRSSLGFQNTDGFGYCRIGQIDQENPDFVNGLSLTDSH